MASGPGRLVALEGVDGTGKTTQARRLAEATGALCTFEPGATALGALLRAALLDPDAPRALGRAEALLMAADRAQHVTEVVRPAIDAGRWVVTDRFSGSTLAYQGFGRGLPLDALREVSDWAADGTAPDLSVLIDVPLDVARHRLAATAPDRLERLDAAFFSRVREGFRTLAASDPAHWVTVDGDAPVEEVGAAVLAVVVDRLGPVPRGGHRQEGAPGAARG